MVLRRKSIPVNVGGVVIGGAAPIAVQTMTKTDTRDVKATLRQIHELKESGCEIVRPAVPDREAAEALKGIVKGSPLPVIADIHYDHTLALMAIEAGVHCLRLNPGNIPDRDKVVRVVRLGGFVNSAPDFLDGPKVLNGASDLMVAAFGDKGRHARTTVGVAALPADAAVEVEGIFEVS